MKDSRFVTIIILCAICIIVFLFLIRPNIDAPTVRSPVSRAKNDMRSLAAALEAYRVDYKKYPPWGIGADGVNSHVGPKKAAFSQPTFRMMLTTPVAYIQQYPLDCFAEKKAKFAYYTDGDQWIIWSPGPDDQYDIDPKRDWDPKILQPSEKLTLRSYDPTNGAISSGDIFRVSQ